MSSTNSWKEELADSVPEELEHEVEVFETQMDRVACGEISEKLFIEARLRRGIYGQRYDNGQRYDGVDTQKLDFPCGEKFKGPNTVWDAPGMQRVKVPYGKLTAEQLDVLAELAEEISDDILHVTTRQDIQLHYVHIEDTPDMMRRLAGAGITTREACGNSVRNITACPYAGVCGGEGFDITPYAHALTYFLLGHPDVQDFGRKFKIAFSGCKEEACGLVNFHDLGIIAATRQIDGKRQRGFEFYVGGGLGAVPFEAKVLHEFLPEEELLPWAQAVCRVFGRLGERRSRARARIKFLVKKLGFEEFKRLVIEERDSLRPDPRWTDYLEDLHRHDEEPVRPGGALPATATVPDFDSWSKTNLRPQAQAGYYSAIITLPLGDFTAEQSRGLAELARRFTGDTIRTTVDQNLVFRWLSGADAEDFYAALRELGLHLGGAGTITDATSCPGTDTCKLGISSSRGLTREIRNRLTVIQDDLDPAVRDLRIKSSGCFNSCGQHHVADLGFYGVARTVGGRRVPHFQVVLGGEWKNNGGSYGMAIAPVPSKYAPIALERVTQHFTENRQADETFQDFILRVGKSEIRALLKDLLKPPSYEEDPSFYSDWGDPREYSIGDMGVGECAGEVVPWVEFGLEAAEQEVFNAQLKLDAGEASDAARAAFDAMVTAAKALIRHIGAQVRDEADDVVLRFREHLHDTGVFNDPFAGPKFGRYILSAHQEARWDKDDLELAHQSVDEALIFIEAAHGCYGRITVQRQEQAAE